MCVSDIDAAPGRGKRVVRVALATLPFILGLSACGEQGARPTLSAGPAALAAPAMHDGPASLAPQGWLEYCARTPQDLSCKAALVTPERVKQLRGVQAALRKIPRKTDQQIFGAAEFWQVADLSRGGDCEDIALWARAQLLAAGWPASSLRLATAWTERDEYHLVLTVDVVTNGQVQTLILDNRYPQVQSYGQLRQIGYRFETRQAAVGSGWVKIDVQPTLPRVQIASLPVPPASTATAAIESPPALKTARPIVLATYGVAPIVPVAAPLMQPASVGWAGASSGTVAVDSAETARSAATATANLR